MHWYSGSFGLFGRPGKADFSLSSQSPYQVEKLLDVSRYGRIITNWLDGSGSTAFEVQEESLVPGKIEEAGVASPPFLTFLIGYG
jgi:hypothetical protein